MRRMRWDAMDAMDALREVSGHGVEVWLWRGRGLVVGCQECVPKSSAVHIRTVHIMPSR